MTEVPLRLLAVIVVFLNVVFPQTDLVRADAWRTVDSLTVESSGDATRLRSDTEGYGIYRAFVEINSQTPKKIKWSFRYRTDPDKPANASFAATWTWYGSNGKALKEGGSYKTITPSTNGFRRILYLLDVPAEAERLELRFQKQGPVNGKFIPSSIELSDIQLVSFGQTQESLMLLAKPHTQSSAEKRWPTTGLRGVNTVTFGPLGDNSDDPGQFLSDAAFKRMAGWNINLLRLWVNVDSDSIWNVKKGGLMPPVPADDPMAPYKRHLDGIRVALHLAEKYQMQVIITVSDIIGRKIDVMFTDSAGAGYEQELTKVWRYIAREFGKHPNVIGFDLLNEPNTKEEMELWQKQILPALCKEVRAIDKNTYLVIEPGPWGLPWGFENFRPIQDAKVVYSFHHYMPHSYTHQGIGNYKSSAFTNKPYPGMLSLFGDTPPIPWNKEELEKSMAFAIDFAKKNNALMFIGEFSALRWAPGASEWIKDSVDIFEKHGWSWAYHCYRGWNGWNPTFDPNDPPSNDPDGGKMTESLKGLIEVWKKNGK